MIHYDELFGKPQDRGGRIARGRLPPGRMNKTESEYDTMLEYRTLKGEIVWRRFEGITLKLADDTRYTPDFFIMLTGGELECHEVKGHWEDDALVKVKVAASLFPFRFVAVHKVPKRDGGGWKFIDF